MRYIQSVLTVIAMLLGIIALRPIISPPPVRAQFDRSSLYIEPGTTMIRNPDGLAQMIGKVVIDTRTGDIWGFPTLEKVPYPVDRNHPKPPVSQPMYLGRFDFSKMNRPAQN